MKQSKFFLTAMALLSWSSFQSVSAHDLEIDGIYYAVTSSTSVSVTFKGDAYDSYADEYKGDVIIPEKVSYSDYNFTVTGIGERAFSGCPSITSISIPNGVTSIGSSSFNGCTCLSSISIPNSVTSIGENAFEGCTGTLTMNCDVPSLSASTSNGRFYGGKFSKLIIGDEVTSIGENAFSCCSFFSSITIGKGVKNFGRNAFLGCTGELIVNCDIPAILNESSFPVPIKMPPIGVFSESGFTKVIIGDEVTSIGNYAFYKSYDVTSVTLGKAVKEIGNAAFSGCRISSLTIPNSVTNIGDSAFRSCGKLASLTLPNTITSIGNSVFYNCHGLTSLTIPNSVTSIGNAAFYNCSGLTSLTIPNSVTSIGESAFSGCSGLTSLTIPNSVTSIGLGAFARCTGELFVNCNIPSVWYYESGTLIIGVFWRSEFTNVVFGDDVTSIGDYAFYESYFLNSVIIGKGVTSIGKEVFGLYSSFSSITTNATTPPTCESTAFSFVDKSLCVLNVPDGCIDAYRAAPVWSEFLTITGLDDVRTEYERPRDVYNLRGEKVKTGLFVGEIGAGLPSGMYIMDGKKIMVK